MSRCRATIVQLALAALLLRALVPAGFMAAPLSEGWPLQLCPAGMAAASFQVLLGSPPQHDGQHANHSLHKDSDDKSHTGTHAHADGESEPACGLSVGYSALVSHCQRFS